MTNNSNYNGPPMLAIDGTKIRQLREERELTQLYIATVVEVTTDTISRWENRRYPCIKKVNGEKLALALSVPLADILEKPGNNTNSPESQDLTAPPPAKPTLPTTHRQSRIKRLLYAPIIITIIIIVLLGWWYIPNKEGIKQTSRYLPAHIPPGQIFPVIISITADAAGPLAMIVKETIEPGATIIKGNPDFTSLTQDGSTIKWVRRATGGKIIYSYIARSSRATKIDTTIACNGTVTSGRKKGETTIIAGPNQIIIKPFHWADLNSDNRIDDEEILAVYEQLNLINDLDFNRDLIDTIWSGSGYRWDYRAGKYIIFP